MVQDHIHVIVIVISIFNVVVHITGIYCLICLRRSAMNGSQRLFLLHLSISELCLSLIELTKRFIYMTNKSNDNTIAEYMKIIQFSSAAMVYYFIMIYMTADRFFAVYLNMKYKLYWSECKARRLLISTWVIFFILAIVISLLYKYKSIDYNKLFYIYTWPITEAVFLVVAFGTYGYVIQRVHKRNKSTNVYRTSSQHFNINNNIKAPSQERRSILMQPSFYLPTVLILTFILLQVIPDLTVLFVIFSGETVSDTVVTGVFMAYMISIFLDAVIYILLSPLVKRMVINKFFTIKPKGRRNFSTRIPLTQISTKSHVNYNL